MVIAGLDRCKGEARYTMPLCLTTNFCSNIFLFLVCPPGHFCAIGGTRRCLLTHGRHTIQAKTAWRRLWWSLVLLLPVRRGSGAREPRKRSGGATKPIALPKHGGKRARPCLYGVPPRAYYFLLYSLHSLGAKVAGVPGTRSVA